MGGQKRGYPRNIGLITNGNSTFNHQSCLINGIETHIRDFYSLKQIAGKANFEAQNPGYHAGGQFREINFEIPGPLVGNIIGKHGSVIKMAREWAKENIRVNTVQEEKFVEISRNSFFP